MADQLHIEFQPGKSGVLNAILTFHDQKMLFKEATFTFEAEVDVHDSRPVNGSKKLFTEKFKIMEKKHTVAIPFRALNVYTYRGGEIDVLLRAKIKVDDGIIWDSKQSADFEFELGWMKPEVNTNAQELIDPKDAFDLMENLKAIPAKNRTSAIVLAAVAVLLTLGAGGIALAMGAGFISLVVSLVTGIVSGVVVWLLIRAHLRKYASIKFKTLPAEFRPGKSFKVSDLFEGRTTVDLEDVTLRIVACNMEKGQYTRGSGTDTRTVSFKEPCRAVLLYEKRVDRMRAGAAIESNFKDRISFSPMFAALYPPISVSSSHGLEVRWGIQLIHPRFIDHELAGPDGLFRFEDFMSGTPIEEAES